MLHTQSLRSFVHGNILSGIVISSELQSIAFVGRTYIKHPLLFAWQDGSVQKGEDCLASVAELYSLQGFRDKRLTGGLRGLSQASL